MDPSKGKIYWLLGSVESSNAGYRVRTEPLAAGLRSSGYEVEILSFAGAHDQISSIESDASIVIAAKPRTPESYLLLRHLKSRGIGIVLDIFDNYFSWAPALSAKQLPLQWLKFLLLADHILVSTPFLGRTIQSLLNTPFTVIEDTTEPVSHSSLSKWPTGKSIDVLWYGINGNPYFKAGLDDLLNWCSTLASLTARLAPQRRLKVTICTNVTPNLVEVIRRLRDSGLEVYYREWSEDEAESLLQKAHLVLLPTNLTGFSLSKTHNRCSNALLRNCLVLSSPHGPYREIPGAVYSDLDSLCETLITDDESLVVSRIGESLSYLKRFEAGSIVRKLVGVFTKLEPREFIGEFPSVVIVGHTLSPVETVKLIRQVKSDSTPSLSAGFGKLTTQAKLDISFNFSIGLENTIELRISPEAKSVICGVLARNEEAECVRSNDEASFYQADSYEFSLDNIGHTFRVISKEFTPIIKRLGALKQLGSFHPIFIQEWQLLHAQLIAIALHATGFENIEYATTDLAGWENVIGKTDLQAALAYKKLGALWMEYRNNETAWGGTA